MLFICYQAIVIPYRFCFKARAFGPFRFYEFLVDIFFMVDLALWFVTGYYKKGNPVMKRGLIIKHYLRTWFIIDLIATLPYTWFVSERNIDYWPDDDFDETEEIDSEGNLWYTKNLAMRRILLETSKYIDTLASFDLA